MNYGRHHIDMFVPYFLLLVPGTVVQILQDYLVSRMENRPKGQADLVVACQGSSHSERQIFSELINSVEQSGARYTVLYVSDPVRSIQYPSFRELERFLAESSPGNEAVDSRVCDGVCEIKSSLLEGLLVGIVLLIILISGLCCMMGIDTPTRDKARGYEGNGS
ncbi:hypothetical protein TEA_013209 [Camellia sinensis var. sinensis]|uniref:V-type proton ATPase subunit S1/VOA1 transmembrane domain-containing protein n=1 Tax=Camellia sinensis var. sinensis TaxID=542762 RepID=A0A4S4ELR7_CAMSN|nr:hypothetical protein TEA_013209 [Camellia sinensis var. sinensis]